MEHIIQFGVTIDEDKIVKMATDRASNAIIADIHKEIDEYTKIRWDESRLDRIFREECKKVVDENKEHILQEAIARLTYNLSKTKAVKAMIEELENGEV